MNLITQRIKSLEAERDRLTEERDQLAESLLIALEERKETHLGIPAGHYYSPIPSKKELKAREAAIWGPHPKALPAINMNEEAQITLLKAFAPYYRELPFAAQKTPGRRYFFENEFYSYSDAIFLYSMIRHLQPQKIIEVGSGYSSAVTLDTNELFFDNAIQCTFIEPYPDRLLALLPNADKQQVKLFRQDLQDIDLALFSDLAANDILFIDTTHVSKTGSDVNQLYFEVFPRLKSGVYIHIHDIFYPFEYPKHWVYEGRAWNEDYLLRAFLEYNDAFEIIIHNDFLAQLHRPLLAELMPLCLKNTGASIWLRKR